jgi:hypothetical protein
MHQTALPDRGAVATGGVWMDQVATGSGSGGHRRGGVIIAMWPTCTQ